jgi:hypothetical protein
VFAVCSFVVGVVGLLTSLPVGMGHDFCREPDSKHNL